jgi:hypothetical protein
MGDNTFLELLEELDALYSENLTEAYDDATLVTTYKGFKIYSYSKAMSYGHTDAKGNPEPYRTEYRYETKDGFKRGGFFSIEDCKEGVDEYIRDTEFYDAHEKAKKLIDTTAETYRGCDIIYDSIQNAEKGIYAYRVEGSTRTADYVVSDIAEKSFKSVDEAKKAIDECIREWNAYADTGDEYKESFRRFIRESLAALDA